MNAEQNNRLLQEIDANRLFMLQAYQGNPDLLAKAEVRIRQLFEPAPFASSLATSEESRS